MQGLDIVFAIAILIMSVVVHEVSHGYAASLLGDQTARYEGRLTLNPIKHLDPIGSILVPLITSLAGFTFGWAKPVPVNPYNLRNRRWGELVVAAVGPLSNLALAAVFAALVRLAVSAGYLSCPFLSIAATIVFINILLAVFNLVPIPPLDGSKVLFNLLPLHFWEWRERFERASFLLVILFILFFWQFLQPVILWLFSLFLGPVPGVCNF